MPGSLAERLHGGPVTAAEVERVCDTPNVAPGRPGPRFLTFSILLLLAFGEPTLARGSLLLFLTNESRDPAHRRSGVHGDGGPPGSQRALGCPCQAPLPAITARGLLIITIPLSLTSERLIATRRVAVRSEVLARRWLVGSGYRVQKVVQAEILSRSPR
ncbi:MAG: hypothetical protein VKI83_11790 [Synechococcaceae cyanobacterium]|nr:hypothetical protein [Synechococcaceae cyanobacterium]